jgi:hypothetical protein
MERDELLLFPHPNHQLEAYVQAHQLAGDLELVDADKLPPSMWGEADAVLDRLARAPKAVRK